MIATVQVWLTFNIKYDRCLIEEQYGKALIKLAKTGSSKDEMGYDKC